MSSPGSMLSPTSSETPRSAANPPAKLECVCTYNRDMGKLLITDKYVQYRSLHFDEKLLFSNITQIKRKGSTKISIKTSNAADPFVFGPFDAVRRGVVFETLRACHEAVNDGTPDSGVGAGGSAVTTVSGLDDHIVTEIFDEPVVTAEPPAGMFAEADDKDTVCIDETFPIHLRPLFALIMSDSSDFLEKLHTQEGDIDLVFNKWCLDDSKSYHTRLFDFRKKTRLVNALVHQTQNVRLKNPKELMVETSNRMEGVPFSDCFTVDTKWRITEQADMCRICVWTRVNFTKSISLMKGKIERNSIQGTVDYFKAYAAMLRTRFVGGAEQVEGAPASGAVVSNPQAGPRSDLSPILAITLGFGCALFFILWLWYWWSAGSWAVYVGELEARNLELEAMVSDLHSRGPAAPADMRGRLLEWEGQIDAAISILQGLKREMGTNLNQEAVPDDLLNSVANKVASAILAEDAPPS